jgi:hypothetical protein
MLRYLMASAMSRKYGANFPSTNSLANAGAPQVPSRCSYPPLKKKNPAHFPSRVLAILLL